ncbi:MAG: sigma-54-dependent Fis family transcriptional regulator [Nitrospinae bacterium]|nr:sigma-54-dependent Fis family transcriptional regulator [Nitrospinota bacterium]
MESKSVLVVDDEEEMRSALKEALSRAGHAVLTARDGEEGLRMFEERSPNIVISDVRMPRMNGLDLLRAVRVKNRETPFVIITAYASVDDAVTAMKDGATDYLLKPFSADTLDDLFHRVFDNGERVKAAVRPRPAEERGAGSKREIITSNEAMTRVVELARKVASSKSTALIHGESGTGKELLSRFIHENSDRANGPFVAVNCAALPETLLESELFGHEKGSFTGAIARKMGKFELADKGTILLDEITEMDPQLQAKLLRVLQEGEIDRVGGAHPTPVDVRVLATTNRDIKKAVAEGKFREDLYFRLNVIPLYLPPLRDRTGDIPILVSRFIDKFNRLMGKSVTGVNAEAMDALAKNQWKGNVRELENVMERAVLLASGETITLADLMMEPASQPEMAENSKASAGDEAMTGPSMTVAEMERKLILRTLDRSSGNRTKAAETLGVSIRTLRNKLNEYKISHGIDV